MLNSGRVPHLGSPSYKIKICHHVLSNKWVIIWEILTCAIEVSWKRAKPWVIKKESPNIILKPDMAFTEKCFLIGCYYWDLPIVTVGYQSRTYKIFLWRTRLISLQAFKFCRWYSVKQNARNSKLNEIIL